VLALQREEDHVSFFNEALSSAIAMTSVVLEPGVPHTHAHPHRDAVARQAP
jgi:hypothetical protein